MCGKKKEGVNPRQNRQIVNKTKKIKKKNEK